VLTVLAAANPSEYRGLLELAAVFLGVTKYWALAIAAGAAVVGFTQDSDGNKGVAMLAFGITGGAIGWFVAGLAFGS
jgi:hypothetical protein